MSLGLKGLLILFSIDFLYQMYLVYKEHKQYKEKEYDVSGVTEGEKVGHIYTMFDHITSGIISILAVVGIILDSIWMYIIFGTASILFFGAAMYITLKKNRQETC